MLHSIISIVIIISNTAAIVSSTTVRRVPQLLLVVVVGYTYLSHRYLQKSAPSAQEINNYPHHWYKEWRIKIPWGNLRTWSLLLVRLVMASRYISPNSCKMPIINSLSQSWEFYHGQEQTGNNNKVNVKEKRNPIRCNLVMKSHMRKRLQLGSVIITKTNWTDFFFKSMKPPLERMDYNGHIGDGSTWYLNVIVYFGKRWCFQDSQLCRDVIVVLQVL